MKLIIVKLSIIILLGSCIENIKENPTIKNEIINSERSIAVNLSSYCFYKLDDKNSTEKDSLVINNWLKEKSQIILKNDSVQNLFQRNGGGPNGAEWNPATDLFIAILTTDSAPTEAPKIYLNGTLHKNQVYSYSPNLIWHRVNYDVWEQKLKHIEPNDIQSMFSAEFLNGIKNGEFQPNVPLEYGEVLRFDISFNEKRISKIFHSTYGE